MVFLKIDWIVLQVNLLYSMAAPCFEEAAFGFWAVIPRCPLPLLFLAMH